MSELENDGIIIDDSPALSDLPENDNQPVAEEPITPATPGQAPVDTPPAETEDQKQARLAREAFEARTAKRELKELRDKLAAMEHAQTQKPKPEVPAMPDPSTVTVDQYEAARKQREEAIREAAVYDTQQQSLADQQRAVAQAREMERQEALNKAVEGYSKRAVQLGVKPDELHSAGMMVGQYITDRDVGELIVNDEQGPLITKYLAQNPDELERVSTLTPIQAALYIDRVVKPKAASLKPKVSSAPDPIERPGTAALPRDYGVKGATFE